MPMQPRPRAETSRLLLPSVRCLHGACGSIVICLDPSVERQAAGRRDEQRASEAEKTRGHTDPPAGAT